MSPQDRELARHHRRAGYGIGANPALLLIDLYQRAFGDRPLPVLEAIEDNPSSCGLTAWEALPHIERLLQGARGSRLPVVHVTGDAQVPGWRVPRGGQRQTRDEATRAYQLFDSVRPKDDEITLVKSAPSAFFGTPLASLLRQWGIDSLIVAGESTSGCVRASVIDARSHRFSVTVVEECVFDRTEASHAINLFDMDQKYADVIAIDDVLTALKTR